MTSAIPVQRSTNLTNKPTGSWSKNWVQINIQVNDVFRYISVCFESEIKKIHNLSCSAKRFIICLTS